MSYVPLGTRCDSLRVLESRLDPEMKIVGLVSSYREGQLLESAIGSLAALDAIVVFEGPVEQNADLSGPESVIPNRVGSLQVNVVRGEWPADAAKRTAMIEWCHTRRWLQGEDVWGLWLDGDEILLWGEYLADWIRAAASAGTLEDPVAGWPISLVELDGSVAWCMGKLVRVDLIEKYLISSSFIQMRGGETRTVGNVQCWTPTDGPTQFTESAVPPTDKDLDRGRTERLPHWRARPPLAGEPHLQHRWMLRPRERQVERQHKAEERNYEGVVLP